MQWMLCQGLVNIFLLSRLWFNSRFLPIALCNMIDLGLRCYPLKPITPPHLPVLLPCESRTVHNVGAWTRFLTSHYQPVRNGSYFPRLARALPVCVSILKLVNWGFIFVAEAAALPVDTGLAWTNCRWIFRTKLLHLQLICSYWASRLRGPFFVEFNWDWAVKWFIFS